MFSELEISLPSATGLAVYPPGASYGPRLTHDFEFVWLLKGDAVYRRDDIPVAAPQGSIILCRPGATDFFQWDPTRRTRHGFVHFDLPHFPHTWPPLSQWPLALRPGEDHILWALFRHLLAGQSQQSELEQRLTLTHILVAYLAGVISDKPPRLWPEPVERAWSWLHQTLEDDPAAHITLNELAGAACVTPEHLCRLFRAVIGHSPLETVRLARLERASTLLARSNYGVAEIADMCGFASPFHFSRVFKAAFGLSPRALRHAIRLGTKPPPRSLLQ